MADNKFIKHLKGENTAKSLLEVRNQNTPTSFANMPDGNTSNANDAYSDHRGNATGVLKGTENWKLDGQTLVETTAVYGDGRDFIDSFSVFGNGLWVDATCTFATARRFSPNTKFVLKLCGHDLETVINHTVDFTLIVKFGVSNLISKTFTVTEQAFNFCKEFVIDFAESNSSTIKAGIGSTMQVQLLCADANARAVLYNGMTVFTALQRRVDGDTVASDKKTFDEVVQDIDDINDSIDHINNDIKEINSDIGQIHDDIAHLDNTFVLKAGDTMSGALNIADIASSNTPLLTLTHSSTATYKWNIAPWYNGTTLSIYPGSSERNGFRFATTGFVPASTNARYLGAASLKWKGVYTAMINNGADLVVPNKAGTLATMGDVELAARSGTQLTDQGVWYAKMYAATVAPSAEDGTNYADFSQVDGQGNPIIVTYNRVNGAWVQDQTITPPAEYDGYVIVTSKIWDIAEQTGQQGGRILWNHQSKEFTPYPQIISFEDIGITGDSTVIMPENPGANQIVNKDYVDNHIPTGNFYHPDLFDWKWADHQLNDVQWLRADTFSWQSGSVYKAAYKHLRNDMYNWYSWENNGTTIYTKKAYPEVGEKVYSDSALTTEVGEITDVTDTLDITVEKITVNGVVYDSVSGSNITPTTETVGGVTVQYIPAEDGHKIVTDFHESEVADIYTATGVAWYYIIDYGSKRFKLPRTKFGVTGIRSGVGGFVEEGLPNITGITPIQNTVGTPSGAFYKANAINAETTYSTASDRTVLGFDASLSNSIYGNSNTVQPKATQMYLYFYVGEFTQTAIENTAGLNAELFNDKVDVGHEVIAFQAPTAGNNYTWYRKYADGWVEQGGIVDNGSSTTTWSSAVTFPVEMSDTNYSYQVTPKLESFNTNGCAMGAIYQNTTTGFTLEVTSKYSNAGNTQQAAWRVEGMAA